MSYNSRTKFEDVRPTDPSMLARWAEERRLCAIIESDSSSVDEKYEALIELAYSSGVLVSDQLANAA